METYLFCAILLLNLVGSGVYLLSKVLFIWAGGDVNERVRYFSCIAVMLLYLIPIYQILPAAPVFDHTRQERGESSVILSEQPLRQGHNAASEVLEPASEWTLPDYGTQRVVMTIWLTGAVAVMLWNLFAFRHFRRKLAWRHGKTVSEHLQETADLCAEEYGIRHRPILRSFSNIQGPMLIGFFKPIIALPEREIPLEGETMILKHELVHFKRHDLWWKLLGVTLQALYWFNPLVWILRKELEFYMETSCDAEVVRNLDHTQRKQYGYLLISYVRTRRPIYPQPGLSFLPEHKQLKRRIFVMIHGNKSKRVVTAAIVGVMAVSSLALSAYAAEGRYNIRPRGAEQGLYSSDIDGYSFSSDADRSRRETDGDWADEKGTYGDDYCRRSGRSNGRGGRSCRRQQNSCSRGQRGNWA